MSPRQAEPAPAPDSRVSFYPAWCKRCGNCVAFCPRQALGRDQWGYPVLANAERCTSCGLCEMLCPDFAISVGGAGQGPEQAPRPAANGRPSPPASPERLAPEPAAEDNGNDNGNGEAPPRGGEGGRG